MASPRLSTQPDTGADGETQSPHAVTAEWVRAIYPMARNIRVLCDIPGDGGLVTATLPVFTPPTPSDIRGAILVTLGKLRAGEWMKGRNVAWDIDEDLDHKGGSFKRAMSELIDDAVVESDRSLGYRLKIKG